jgi:hypothetical protein
MAIAGIEKFFAKVKQITLANVDYSPKAMVAVLQAEIDAVMALDQAKAQLRQQVADSKKVRANALTLRTFLRKYILTTFGSEAFHMLGDFGMKVPKNIGQKTAEVKAQAQAKAKATRKAKRDALKNALSAPAAPAASLVSATLAAK